MGLYDRDYYRDDRPGIRIGGDWSAVVTLIVVNFVVFLVGAFMRVNPITGENWLSENLGLQPGLFQNPWKAWQLLTYGFIHSPTDIWHVVFNMVGLFIFGQDVEGIYGRREFYKLYLSLIILAGLVFSVVQLAEAQDGGPLAGVVGASGGVMGVAVIFACHFPRRLIYIWGIIPVPAMVLVGLYVLMDLLGTQSRGSTVAHAAHLGGAAFGFLYYRTGWSLFRLWPRGWSLKMPRRGPKLRVHRETDEDVDEPADDYLTTGRLQRRVDELLEKISRGGEASLTDEERQFLADASRRYQQQKRR